MHGKRLEVSFRTEEAAQKARGGLAREGYQDLDIVKINDNEWQLTGYAPWTPRK